MNKDMLGRVTPAGIQNPKLMTNGQPVTSPVVNRITLGQGDFAIAPVTPYPSESEINQLRALIPTPPKKRKTKSGDGSEVSTDSED